MTLLWESARRPRKWDCPPCAAQGTVPVFAVPAPLRSLELCARPPIRPQNRAVCGRHLSACGARGKIVLMLIVRCGGVRKNGKREFVGFRNCNRAKELGRACAPLIFPEFGEKAMCIIRFSREIAWCRVSQSTPHAPREVVWPKNRNVAGTRRVLSGCWSTGPRFLQFLDPSPGSGRPFIIHHSSFIIPCARS